MTDATPTPPTWIHKRDGRIEAFEADKISRALFAATEHLGQPDAFKARELTDAILHFLPAETEGHFPTTRQIAELVEKVVREMGHPLLAQAFATGKAVKESSSAADSTTPSSPASQPSLLASSLETPIGIWVHAAEPPMTLAWRVAGAALRNFSLSEVFARDLVATHQDRLLSLGNLEAPLELAGCVLGRHVASGVGLGEAIAEARGIAGQLLVLDGPEYILPCSPNRTETTAQFVRELALGLRLTGLKAIVNLNHTAPPSWTDELAEGPLFSEQRPVSEPHEIADLQDRLLDQLLTHPELIRVDWHLGKRDWTAEGEGRLLRLARRAVDGSSLAFVFDRPRRPVFLAEGIDRRHPAVLMQVGLHLTRLAEQAGIGADPARFLQKLGSLARLALSAAAQKRDFLRRHRHGRPEVSRGFLLDRARLVVVPVGLEAVTVSLQGERLHDQGVGLDFARQVLQRLKDTLHQDGQPRHIDACLDSAAAFGLDPDQSNSRPLTTVAGLTAWNLEAPLEQQLGAAGALHQIAERGTAAVLLRQQSPPSPEEIVALLRHAWHQSDVARLRLQRLDVPPRQLTAPWETPGS